MSKFTFAERLKISQDNPLGIGRVDKDTEIAKLRAENARLEAIIAANHEAMQVINESTTLFKQAVKDRDRYRQALEHYAAEEHWLPGLYNHVCTDLLGEEPGYTKAQAAPKEGD